MVVRLFCRHKASLKRSGRHSPIRSSSLECCASRQVFWLLENLQIVSMWISQTTCSSPRRRDPLNTSRRGNYFPDPLEVAILDVPRSKATGLESETAPNTPATSNTERRFAPPPSSFPMWPAEDRSMQKTSKAKIKSLFKMNARPAKRRAPQTRHLASGSTTGDVMSPDKVRATQEVCPGMNTVVCPTGEAVCVGQRQRRVSARNSRAGKPKPETWN